MRTVLLMLVILVGVASGQGAAPPSAWSPPPGDTNHWTVVVRPKPAAATNAPPASVASTNAVIPAVGKLQVLGSKWVWGQFHTAEVIGCVRNNTGDSYRYVQVTANFYSKSGALLGSSMANVLNLGPHEKWIFKIPVLNPEADSWRISAPEGSSF